MNNSDIQQVEKGITQPQIKKIHVLLGQLDMMDEKKERIMEISNGRTSSCRELTRTEAGNMIALLEDFTKGNKDARDDAYTELIKTAKEWGYIYGDTDVDRQINDYLLDKFCLERGTVKKQVWLMTLSELQKTLRQFKAILKSKQSLKVTQKPK